MPRPWQSLRAISRRLATGRCPHLPAVPGRTGTIRTVSSTPGHATVAREEENDTLELDAEDVGSYSVILPPEPYIFGVSHVPQRPVPSHIARPPYITADGHPTPSGDGRIQLGSPAEWRLRRAAQLAREVLEYAGTLVKVKAGIVVFQPR